MQLLHKRLRGLHKQLRQDYLQVEVVRHRQQLDLRLLLLLRHCNNRSQLYLNEMLFRNLLDKEKEKD
jgi:hypothetical protein